MMKKVGITVLFILICAFASLVLMEVFNETTGRIKGFYYVEDHGGERDLNLGPGKEGRTISERRLDKPIVVDEYLPWIGDPFSGEIGSGKRFMYVAKKYGILVVLAFVCLFWYLRHKKKRKVIKEDPAETSVSRYTVNKDQLEGADKMPFTLSDEKLNEIRQMVKDWETRLNTLNRKKHHETIQEWFKRINGPAEIIPVYEKVRYGDRPFTHKELQLLKEFLR
ncbi:hypothetical protein NQ095_01430 [Rossellomorea sp. SC111]|uniref:hypothetical protein n=1 Tax=Rossellomorea sp. SC111 TaxID=2968985 RepID=UPI00215AEE85|nr:hypothetical protein [Rossellomorea sp. SC111]MCR8847053.1 hypothetical protein [Rossellomorea sp. SC111]